eukprot:356791-Chlamydomonas_euryale.AAC.8
MRCAKSVSKPGTCSRPRHVLAAQARACGPGTCSRPRHGPKAGLRYCHRFCGSGKAPKQAFINSTGLTRAKDCKQLVCTARPIRCTHPVLRPTPVPLTVGVQVHSQHVVRPSPPSHRCAGAGGACRGGGWRCCRRGGHGDELTHACELLAEAGFEGPWRVCMSARMSVCMSACLTREPLVVRVQGQFALGVQRTSRTCVGEWRVRLFVRACTCVGGVARPVGELCAASAEITL